ncbi:MAG TPA: NAD(P)-dependent oxidoreductase [Chitinophagaceae bacterium]|nr:NAD(P)-dependent oxidoreductase [Chitinophagaceae bacterium]
MSEGKVLIAAPVHPVLTAGLEKAGYELLCKEQINQQQGMELICDCVGVITSTRLQVDREMIDRAPGLKFIGRMGSGMEVIDVPYAEAKGIRCISSPEGNRNAVAEHTLGMLLNLTKNISRSFEEVKNGKWLREENRGTELEGKTIGIIGYGHTGSAFARLLRGFDLKVLVYDKYKEISGEPFIQVCSTLAELQEQCDILSLHVPHQPDTVHMIDRQFIEGMKKSFILLNTSRGSVIDSGVLESAMHSGKLKGLAIDVWEEEPLEKMSQHFLQILNNLIKCDKVLITPHIGGYTDEALFKMSDTLLERVIQ